jgi:predicted phage terminase large subunit-like protein
VYSYEDIVNELAVRQIAKANYLVFVKYTMPTFEINWHHRVIAHKLQSFAEGKIKKLMIFLPPQVGKSELSTRRLPPFMLGLNPNLKMAICGYNDTFSKKFNRQIQRIIDNQFYKNIFPDTKLNSKNVVTDAHNNYVRNSEEFEIINYQGSLKAVGIGKGITGNPVDVGIIDDPIKGAEDAYSETYRNKLWDWYETEFKTRLHNNSQQLITLTRWHDDDLVGRILKQEDDWDIVVLPAINEDGTSDIDPRNKGEALWPNRHSLERYLKVKKTNLSVFNSLYQQSPVPAGGTIWHKEWFKVIDDSLWPVRSRFSSYGTDWDTAFTDNEDNAANAFVTAGKIGNDIYIDGLGFDWLEFPELCKWMKSKPSPHYIEDKANGKSLKQTLVKAGVNAILVPVLGGDKVARANLATPVAEAGRVYIRKSLIPILFDDIKQSILKFPNAKHKDLADALAQCLQRLDKGSVVVASDNSSNDPLEDLFLD